MKKYILLSLSLIATAIYAVEPQVHVISACVDSPAITLKSSCSTADYYVWTDGVSTTDSYSFNPTAEGQFTYGVHAYGTQIDTANNLMANGSFENGYTDFTSDFKAITKNGSKVLDPTDVYNNKYDNGTDYGKYYAISSKASNFWPGDKSTNGYYPINAQNGTYFLVVDASDEGYAWRARTGDNPNLKIEKGKTYLFSCWVAFPNKKDQFDDPIAKLQFYIGYRDVYATDQVQPLGEAFSALPLAQGQKPGDISEADRYKWRQHYVVWTATFTSMDDAVIGVKNVTKYDKPEDKGKGNDFCLDNIVFQLVDSTRKELAADSFVVNVEECSCIPIYSMWNDVLFVDNYRSLYTSYQWYRNGAAISGATMQYYRLTSTDGNDTYKCVMQDANGLSYETCESKFADAKVSSNYPEGDHGSKVPVARRMRYRFGQLMVEEITYDDGDVEYRKIIHQ